jgi:hypothetical protein
MPSSNHIYTLDEYGLRFDSEETFLDEKSGGFQLQASELATPEALERLLLIVAIATLHLTSLGWGVVQAGKRRWVDTHWDRGLSYLKMGAVATTAGAAWMADLCSFLAGSCTRSTPSFRLASSRRPREERR